MKKLVLTDSKLKLWQADPLIMTVDDVFTADECQQLIADSHQHAYHVAAITINRYQAELRTEVRNNQRVIVDDHALAARIFQLVKPHLPAQLHGWDLAGLNERFRFYLYEHGQTFKPHYDASYEVNKWHSSQLTLLVYLNDGYTGGETIFYHDSGMRKPCMETQMACIQSKAGQILIFEHQQLHEGALVLAGQKYVLRTDVMYAYTAAVAGWTKGKWI